MDWLITPLAFVVALGVIIFVHESGHLIVARAFNVRVLAFSLGFGKRLWGFKRGETDYRLSLVPLGGYVKLGGETAEEASDDPRDFVNRPRWQRVLVYLAGPAMNLVLAWVLIAVALMMGLDLPPRKLPPVVGLVADSSPAAAAGLARGDRILTIDGKPIDDWQGVEMAVLTAPEKPLAVAYQRGGEKRSTTLTPLRVPRYDFGEAGFAGPGKVWISQVLAGEPAAAAGFEAKDEILAVDGRPISTQQEFIAAIQPRAGETVEVKVRRGEETRTLSVVPTGEAGQGRIGVQIMWGFYQRYSLGPALVESFYYNVDFIRQTFQVLGKVFTREVAAKSALAGPIEIARMSGAEARRGLNYFLHLLGIISVSIAIVNLLPVPVLDGGQTTILLVESVMRRDLSVKVKERLTQVGVVVIFALMLTVIFFDLQKRF
jgi:regulator of sigma E protease